VRPARRVGQPHGAASEKEAIVAPLDTESPAGFSVEYNQTGQADAIPIIAGRERLAAGTIGYRAETVRGTLRLLG